MMCVWGGVVLELGLRVGMCRCLGRWFYSLCGVVFVGWLLLAAHG